MKDGVIPDYMYADDIDYQDFIITGFEEKIKKLEQQSEDRLKTIDTLRNRVKELEFRNLYLEECLVARAMFWEGERAADGMV